MPSPRFPASCIAAALVMLSGCATYTSSTNTEDSVAKAPPITTGGSADGALTDTAPSIQSKFPEISPHRALPEFAFPELDTNSVPIAERHPVDATEIPDQPVSTHDLWYRLRSGFQLSNLEEQPGRVAQFEKWYAKHPKYFERLSERAYWFLPYVLEQVEKRGMPSEVAILPAIESAFRPDATSRSRAAGIWQFIGSTGRRFGLRQDWWMDARRDVVQSTRAALDYLEYLSQEFDGDWELALAAYNAGEGGISRAIKKNRANNLPTSYSYLKLRRETSEYVPRLFAVRNILNDPDKYGIKLQPLVNRPTLRVIDLKHQTDLSVAASYLSLTRKQLHFLNLGYKRGVTPPNGPHILVVPANEAEQLMAALVKLNPSQRMQWAHHKVKKGENLGIIARAHGVNVESVKRANSLASNLIRPGQELRIPLYGGGIQLAENSSQAGSTTNRTHRISAGDTLWRISRRYGVSLPSLMKWNKLSSQSTLYPGQTLIVSQ
ncbi:MAG: LysM peptidoglycan-binding domain-containing protein [bacterium]